MSTVPTVIVLRGLPGVGKTTLSAIIRERLDFSIRISDDDIRFLARPKDLSAFTIDVSEKACLDLAASYALNGFTPIVDGVFINTQVLDEGIEKLHCQGIRTRVFTLDTTLEQTLHRNSLRYYYHVVSLERMKYLHQQFTPYGTIIANHDTIEETAEILMSLIIRED